MILEIQCDSIVMNNFLYIVKNIMNIIMIVAPILAIISYVIIFFNLLKDPEDKKTPKKVFNTAKALIIIFFIPLLVNVVMLVLGENTDISACYNSAKEPSISNNYIEIVNKEGKKVLVDPNEYQKGEPKTLKFECKSNVIKAQLSCDTLKIVEQHYMDFNSQTFKSYIEQQGGFSNYVQSLGGVFSEYYGKTVQVSTVYEFQKVAEYVFGFLTMYGADYFNGKKGNNPHYCKWGGDCLYYNKGGANPVAANDAFYLGTYRHENYGLSDKDHFDNMISNVDNPNITVNCNYTADMIYMKAGILGNSRNYFSDDYNSQAKDPNSRIVTQFSDLQVGDLIHFFHSDIDPANSSTWTRDTWGHVAMVGEVYKEKNLVVMYDGGRYLTDNQNYKWTIDTSTTTKNLYNYEGWLAIHIIDLK